MKATVRTFKELAKFINDNDLSRKQIDLLITKSLNVWMSREIPKTEILPRLEEFIKQYPDIKDRPLFID
jgi:hypothetical protein